MAQRNVSILCMTAGRVSSNRAGVDRVKLTVIVVVVPVVAQQPLPVLVAIVVGGPEVHLGIHPALMKHNGPGGRVAPQRMDLRAIAKQLELGGMHLEDVMEVAPVVKDGDDVQIPE